MLNLQLTPNNDHYASGGESEWLNLINSNVAQTLAQFKGTKLRIKSITEVNSAFKINEFITFERGNFSDSPQSVKQFTKFVLLDELTICKQQC